MREIRMAAETASGFNLVSVQGEAGVGKTRTVKEALEPLSTL
jgi:predicted ATPase